MKKHSQRKWKLREFGFLGPKYLLCILLICAMMLINNRWNQENQQVGNGEDFSSVELEEPASLQEAEKDEEEGVSPKYPSQVLLSKRWDLQQTKPRIQNVQQQIHGIYLTSEAINSPRKLKQVLEMIRKTNINTVVFDVKDDYGKISYETKLPLANEIGAVSARIPDIDVVVNAFHDEGIYVIGRVVCFRDQVVTKKRPEYALHNKDGSIFVDQSGYRWMNPYNRDCWKYILGIAADCSKHGFNEIQFDYMRFSTEAKNNKVSFGQDSATVGKSEVITRFVRSACKVLHDRNTLVSADVFGAIINSEVDQKIVGQDYVELAQYLDYISPMIYPSHYSNGCYGISVPDANPYELIKRALMDSRNVLKEIDEEEHTAIVRPWLQDFTARWVKGYQIYGTKQIQDQIQGVYDAGCTQWLLWNSKGNYTTEAILKR